MFEEIFDRNGAKVFVKNLRGLFQKKSAKRGFFKSPSHSRAQQVVALKIVFNMQEGNCSLILKFGQRGTIGSLKL
jgi:hypothetical protein